MTQLNPTSAVDAHAALFAQMDPPLLRVLGGILEGLDGFSDLIAHISQPGPGQFHGYDGIENRGAVSDILASDWAIYDLDRTEFLRRVAMRETLYRRKSYETSTTDRAICLVVDGGAWMLGQPRLLALGAIFWLAAHADRTGARFYWSDTANPTLWHDGLTKESITNYLDCVAQRELDQTLLDRMIGRLDLPKNAKADMWIVGPKGLDQRVDLTGLRAGLLVDLPQLAPDDATTCQSDVALWSHGVLRRSLPVTYPEDGLCIGAIRRPFAFEPGVATDASRPLHDSWAAQYWVDMPTGQLIVRWPEGLLLLPQGMDSTADPIWIPVPSKAQIVGLSWNEPNLMVLWKDGLSLCQSTINSNPEAPQRDTPSRWTIDMSGYDLDFLSTELPVQLLDPVGFMNRSAPMFDRTGTPFLFNTEKTQFITKYGSTPLVCRDGTSMLRLELEGGQIQSQALTVSTATTARNVNLRLPNAADLLDRPRHMLLATSDTAAMWSDDGITYRIWDRTTETQMTLPDYIVLVQMLGPKKMFGYDPTSGGLVQIRVNGRGKPQVVRMTNRGNQRGLVHLRSACMGRFAYGITLNDGKPDTLTRIKMSGKGDAFFSINIPDTIAQARTIWLTD